MSDLKPIAALSGGLLVRKGGAMPASLAFPAPEPAPRIEARLQTPPGPRSEAPARPRGGMPRRQGDEGPPRMPRAGGGEPPRRGAGSAKVSLRLDPERHQRLRIAALHQRLSGQQLLLAALDAYLADCAASVNDGNCVCLRRQPG